MKTQLIFDLDGTLIQDRADNKTLLIPGAGHTLHWCRSQGFTTLLYSWGDLVTRLERLEGAGLDRSLFDQLYAVPGKTPAIYERVLKPHQGPDTFTIYVGDSWKQDAGVALGRANAVIYIRGHRTPGLYGTPADLENYPVWVVQSVEEIPHILAAVLADPYRGFNKADWAGYWQSDIFPIIETERLAQELTARPGLFARFGARLDRFLSR